MGYVRPESAVNPRNAWKLTSILCNTGHGGWSIAEGMWLGQPCVSMRWNGDDFSGSHGSPNQSGRPTWTIVPEPFAKAMRSQAELLAKALSMVSAHCEPTERGALLLKIQLDDEALALLKRKHMHFNIPNMGATCVGAPTLESSYALNGSRKSLNYLCAPWMSSANWRGVVIGGYWEAMARTQTIDEARHASLAKLLEDGVACSVAQALVPRL